MIKKKQYSRMVLAVAAVSIIVSGFIGVGVRPAAALTCTILPKSICDSADKPSTSTQDSSIMKLLKMILSILTAGVGIAAVAALVYAGILYGSAGDNASQTSSAKTIITNTVIGIIAYAAMVLFVNFLIPGGVFGP